jgi:hypothetical protein
MIGQQSASDYSENSDIKVNPIVTDPKLNWRKQTKLYYSRATAPGLLLEEKDSNFKSFSANNVYDIIYLFIYIIIVFFWFKVLIRR